MIQTTFQSQRDKLKREIEQLLSTRGPLGGRTARLEYLMSEARRLDTPLAEEHEERFHGIFREYLRVGHGGLSAESRATLYAPQRRDMGEVGLATGTASGGGILVPVDFAGRVISSMKDVGPMLDPDLVSLELTQTGRSLPFPNDNDSLVSGFQLNETQQVSTEDVSPMSQTILGAFKFSSGIIKVSMELLRDAGMDLESYLLGRFATRLARIINTKLTTGSGSGEPTGVITASSSAGTAVGAAQYDGVSGANSIGPSDLQTLCNAVDWAYHDSAVFMMHQSTLMAMRAQRDKQGSPVFPGLQVGDVDKLYGYPVRVNNNMDQLQVNPSSPTVSRKPVAFGAFDRFQVRMTRPMLVRLDERFGDAGQVGFMLWTRCDGNITDSGGPVKYLTTSY